jgi:predicted dehydrogenase
MKQRIGIIGCGNISDTYLEMNRKFTGLEVVAVTDMDTVRRDAQAAKYGVQAMDLGELLSSDVAAVVNITPPGAHASVTLQALEAGKHVYSEKPLAVGLEDGFKIRDLAAAKGLRVGCAPDTFLGAGLQTSRDLLESGILGTPLNAFACMTSNGVEGWHPNPHFFYQPGAGPLFDMGPYYITALVHLLGAVKSVTASARKSLETRTAKNGDVIPVNTPTHVSANLEFVSGAIGTLLTTFDVQASTLPRIEVYGSDGTLLAPDPNTFDGPVRYRSKGDGDWLEADINRPYRENSRGIGLADMLAAAQEGRTHRASLELAVHVLETMHAVLKSAEEGRRVTLETTVAQPEALPSSLTF